jgi:hypothetical protein
MNGVNWGMTTLRPALVRAPRMTPRLNRAVAPELPTDAAVPPRERRGQKFGTS